MEFCTMVRERGCRRENGHTSARMMMRGHSCKRSEADAAGRAGCSNRFRLDHGPGRSTFSQVAPTPGQLSDPEAGDIRANFDTLTQCEREVLELVSAGRLNKQIAADIGISLATVKAHRGHVMRKMRTQSLT
jgi:DNA-binding NarL/FixJ family response regulator